MRSRLAKQDDEKARHCEVTINYCSYWQDFNRWPVNVRDHFREYQTKVDTESCREGTGAPPA